MTEETPIEQPYKDIFEPGFIQWFNDKYKTFAVSSPDPNVEPCLGPDGKVKLRGEWDLPYRKQFSATKGSSFEFFNHQKLIRDFFTNESPYRGLLLFHGLGSGKTLTSQAVSENMKRYRQVVVMTPASLRENFISELKKGGPYAQEVADAMKIETMTTRGRTAYVPATTDYETNVRREILRKYFFVSYDASNLPSQIRSLPDGLNHKLLVIDEVHNMISMIMSRSVKGKFLFDAIMNATDLKIIMLSGTPIINDPFELGVMANLLVGYLDNKGRRHIKPANVEDRYKFLLFDDNINFYYYFLDDSNPKSLEIKNKMKLMRRVTGLISYYAGLQPREKILPAQRHHLVPVEMSKRQFEIYEKVRKLERASETRSKIRRGQNLSRTEAGRNFGRDLVNLNMLFSVNARNIMLSTFRSMSRQFCNFVFPPGIARYVEKLGDVNAEDTHPEQQGGRKTRKRLEAGATTTSFFGPAKGEGLSLRQSQKRKTTSKKQASSDKTDGDSKLESVDTGANSPEDPVKYSAEINRIHMTSLKMLEDNYKKYLIEELPEHSMKMYTMMKNILKSSGPAYVYSQFRSFEGIGIFSRVLKAHGYIEYGWGDKFLERSGRVMQPLDHTTDVTTGMTWAEYKAKKSGGMNKSGEAFRPLTYLIWPRSTGNPARRNHLLNIFNGENNKHGHVIKIFLSTKAGAEGINLMNVRQVHIMEPYWNEMRTRQAIGRAIRQCSHATLPKSERIVDVYHYISTIYSHQSEDKLEDGSPESTDQYVRSIALRKQHIIERIEALMKEVAIDCRLNKAHNRLTDPDVVCFDPSGDLNRSLTVDLAQDPGDDELLGERKLSRIRLVKLRLPFGDKSECRITEESFLLLKKLAKSQFRTNDIGLNFPEEIAVYSTDSMQVIGKIVVKRDRPISYMRL